MPTADDSTRLIAGRYRLRSVLGHGSMGTVWSAYDEFLRRPVAVKEVKLPPGVPRGQAEELRERAMREARAIASLSHPNVITLHDVVREEGAPFVVMELLTARSLAGLLSEHGPLSVGQAATVGDALAAALEAAHAAGITHRDVKPGNVLIADDGRVKLTDFGIARNVSEVTMTSAGLMLGSPAYMAPEVASGKKVSPAADLWGLGATLYAVTEGEPPYDAEGDPVATAHQVVHGDVPEPGPGPLADVIRALMSKDPDARPAPVDVRASLHDLRNPPGPLFDAELFAHSAVDETSAQPAQSKPAAPAEDGPSDGTAPLAADPGPLPFATAPTSGAEVSADAATAGRSATRTALVLVLATVLFLAAVAGGFAAARTLGGLPVLPALAGSGDDKGTKPPASGVPEDEPLVKRSGEATIFSEEEGAHFSVQVPASWTRFASLQAAGPLPASTLIQFVSADGRQVLSVQRFGAFFPDHDVAEYEQMLKTSWPDKKYELEEPAKPRVGDVIMYRTVESGRGPGAGGNQGRTTFAELRKDGPHLWVVSVTVPTEQEVGGRTRLFYRLVRSFTIS